MKLLWKLLREHISVSQLTGFFLSNLVGTIIMLLTIQLYADLRPLFTKGDSFMKSDYMVVSKPVSAVSSLLGKNHTFSTREIEELKDQPFTRNVGAFTPSQFEIYIALRMPDSNQSISSDIFFESVPDKYIDVDSDRWNFNEHEGLVPIIVPRNYLNLYNFGFSQSRNLPKLSEGTISLIALDVNIRGNGKRERFKGNIIGFSDRLNTILVPQSFMEWANNRFSGEQTSAPTRLILEVNNPTDDAIATFFAEKNYTTENDKLDSGKISYLLRLTLYTVLAIGLFISLLSLYILTLSIFLLLEKSNKKLENLLLIGYTPSQVSRPYQLLTAAINLMILVLAVGTVSLLRLHYIEVIDTLFPQGTLPTMLPSILFGVILTACVTTLNYMIIKGKIRSISK